MLEQSFCPKYDALRMTQDGRGEIAPAQNNKSKTKQLKLNKTYLSNWLGTVDSSMQGL
jgi:hypothetical protein